MKITVSWIVYGMWMLVFTLNKIYVSLQRDFTIPSLLVCEYLNINSLLFSIEVKLELKHSILEIGQYFAINQACSILLM